MTAGRRTFLRWTLGGVAGLAVTDASVLGASTMSPDDPWLTAIAAKKHKAFLDVMHFFPDGTPFRRAKNLLSVLHESYGAAVSERIVRGLHEGVEPVPAMIAAAVQAQAREAGYVALA